MIYRLENKRKIINLTAGTLQSGGSKNLKTDDT